MKHISIFLILLLCGVPGSLLAQRQLGGERVGTSAFTFLKIGEGARAQAMAGAYTAIAGDAGALFWNPAGAAQRSADLDVSVGYNQWIADLDLYSAAVVKSFGSVHHIGVSALALATDPMEITTEYHPEGTGEYFNYGDVLLGLTYALRMTDRFSFGITGKLAEEQLADLIMRGYMFDIGTFYRTGFRDLNFAVALLNFGAPAKPEGRYLYTGINGETEEAEYQDFAPPTIFRMGIAYEWLQQDHQQLVSTIQLNHPVDEAESRVLGLEYALNDLVFLRGGYIDQDEIQSWSIGFGLKVANIRIDYSYSDMSELSGNQRFNLGWSW